MGWIAEEAEDVLAVELVAVKSTSYVDSTLHLVLSACRCHWTELEFEFLHQLQIWWTDCPGLVSGLPGKGTHPRIPFRAPIAG